MPHYLHGLVYKFTVLDSMSGDSGLNLSKFSEIQSLGIKCIQFRTTVFIHLSRSLYIPAVASNLLDQHFPLTTPLQHTAMSSSAAGIFKKPKITSYLETISPNKLCCG